ncbi:MFS transporter [Jatrophihabitans cynanchi]|uniref:MFS transporter n=1 Tax=Jatrophihabitans cynanchi TaxID=2944128 RepID=A0ABY7JY85_9ACTN|nr:MFS transporter [Jatrophihabitans sp. SB3-54]WAX56670.1 MFS transporter [Jatrophihabitans sp. SB3-54]
MAVPGTALARHGVRRLEHLVGGRARRQVVVAFACVLALDSADKATVGANATQLQSAFGIGKAQIGLLLAVGSAIGALATIPAGMLVDRVRRTRLIAIAVLWWGVAMLLSGFATGLLFLLLARVALGLVTAVSGPAVASLVGDYFPEHDRGRIYGYVLAGELIGAGFGFVVSGQLAALSWRAPFFFLVVPTLLVFWLIRRLPEPARGGASRLPGGADEIRSADDIESGRADPFPTESAGKANAGNANAGSQESDLARKAARRANVAPRPEALLDRDPAQLSLWEAVRYVLRVRTNVVLITASALGYFFFSGVRGFAIEFSEKHYRIGQGAASSLTLLLGIGALLGVLSGGRLADRLLARGRAAARVEVPGVSVLLAGLIFVPALLVTNAWLAAGLLMVAALFLGMSTPPLDAARLDIIHPGMWGRAEGVRTVLRNGADASAPVLFGVLAQTVFGGDSGLQYTFLVMLLALFASAVITLSYGRREYPRDVIAAARSLERTAE